MKFFNKEITICPVEAFNTAAKTSHLGMVESGGIILQPANINWQEYWPFLRLKRA